MTDNRLIRLQVFYEIAMAIGKSLDLAQMLHQSLSTYLRKLNCSTGMVLRAMNRADIVWEFEPVFTVPRHADRSAVLMAAFQHIPDRLGAGELDKFYDSLPIIAELDNDRHFYLMVLPGFGLLLLVKAGPPLDDPVVKSLDTLNIRLAEACLVCLQSEEVAVVNAHLRREINERLRVEGKLREVLDGLETRVAARTRDLLETNQKLEEALADIKILSGLLPICSVCKKVRDDQGYWSQIESYIADHSDAVFSHGFCPECLAKLYPELAAENTDTAAG